MPCLREKILALVLSVTLLVSGAVVPAFGDEDGNSSSENENRIVKVGVFDFDGYHMMNENGNLTGYGIELLELIERYSHLEMKLVGYSNSWAEMQEMLQSGEIDMVTSARQTPEREKIFAFSTPVGSNKTVLSVAESNRDIIGGNYSTYDGMRIGLLEGSTQNEKLEDYAEKHGFSYVPVMFKEADDLTEALAEGSIDAILTSNLRKGVNERIIDTVDEDAFYAIVRKDDTELLDEINYALEEINLHEGDWQNVLFYRYYGAEYSEALGFTEREKAYIEQVQSGEKTITVTAMVDRMPYSYVEGGTLRGILLDYFALVMGEAKLPYQVVAPLSADSYMELIEHNGVDVVVDAIVADSTFETDGDEFSGFNTAPYMEAGFAMVTGPNYSGSAKKVAVGDPQTERIVKDHLGDAVEVVRFPTTSEAMQAVEEGRVDAAYVYSYSAQQFINRDGASSLRFNLVHDLNTQFAMYVANSVDHELVTILDKCIQRVPEARLDQLISEYTTYSVSDLTIEEVARANPTMVSTAIISFLVIVGVIIALFARTRWNRRLLRAEEASNRELGDQLAIVDALSRDYTNVFAVDVDKGTARVVKLEGYTPKGIDRNADADTEYAYGDILANYIEARVHPDEKEKLAHDLSLATVKEALSREKEYLGIYRIAVGEDVSHYQYSYSIVSRGEGGTFVLAGFRNVDEVIRNEQEQKEKLAEALAQAQYASRAKTTFLNSMSHDIRTPMNAIIGFTGLASASVGDPEKVQGYLDKIMTSSNHLLSLINDVLDMSRIESGKVKIDEEAVSLPVVIEDLRTIVQSDINTNKLAFSVDMSEVTDDVVLCDKLRLNQVLLNIISNAMKYTEPGGQVSVRIRQLPVEADGYATYEFRVKDTGIGMSAEFVEHVFEPFERENTATVTGIQGTGLGLAITKNIVDVMGGQITVESEVGIGSEFIVRLRLRVAEGTAPVATGAKKQSAAPSLEGKKILLVEDNELNAEIAVAILEGAGLIVDTAEDGTVAVEKMKQNPAGTYDLILTDVQMPLMDGYEETRVIRALDDPRKAGIPIVAMTANAFEEDRAEAESAGMNGYVCKPINVKELMGVLSDIL